MPEQNQTTLARKVYIVTGKDATGREAAFQSLFKDFSITESAQSAEFIVLDCNDPGSWEWLGEASQETFWVTEKCYPPVILADFEENEAGKNYLTSLKQFYKPKQCGTDWLFVCKSPDELRQTLRRLQAALPFYNDRNLIDNPIDDPVKKAMLVQRTLELSRLHFLLYGRQVTQ